MADIDVVFARASGASCLRALSDERIVNPSLGSDLEMPLLPSRTVLVQRWGQYANDTAVGTGSVGGAQGPGCVPKARGAGVASLWQEVGSASTGALPWRRRFPSPNGCAGGAC